MKRIMTITKSKQNVLNSAKTIISLNIENGDFLTRTAADQTPIVFSEWKPLNLRSTTKIIKVQRTEYTLDEIYENVKKENGRSLRYVQTDYEQLDIFSFLSDEIDVEEKPKEMIYIPISIVDIYKEEMEEV